MTNYSVPFDFDGTRFLWVEFLSEKERNICVYNIDTIKKWSFSLTSSFGHISHCKLLPGNRILLVRLLNSVEIRELDDQFTIIYNFKNIGDEVIALDFYTKNKNKINDLQLENIQIASGNKEQYQKIPKGNDKELVNIEDNKIKEEEVLVIVLLDIDGNLNIIENFQKTVKKFNLYEVKEISEDIKNKQYFSMGYPYYIKTSSDFFVISTDHGVFIIKV